MAEELFYWQALNRALDEAMARDDSIFVLGEDVGLFGGSYRVTEGLWAKYGEWRVRDTPISENSYAGLGVGAAMTGLRPVVEIMTINFALLALDAIINLAAKIPLMSGGQFPIPLVIRMPSGVARQLGAQHSQRLEHTMMNVPGIRIATPASPQDAYWQLHQAVASDDFIVVLEHELLYNAKGPIERDGAPPMHRAMVRREGSDLTIVAYSRMVGLALTAAETLAGQGMAAEVIDLRGLRPIDWAVCEESARKTGHVLVVEEDCRFAGAGAEVAAGLTERCFDRLEAAPLRLAALDMPTPFNARLEQACIPQVGDIVEAGLRLRGKEADAKRISR